MRKAKQIVYKWSLNKPLKTKIECPPISYVVLDLNTIFVWYMKPFIPY